MIKSDRKIELEREVAKEVEEKLDAMAKLHENMAKQFERYDLEEAQYMENLKAGWYRNFMMEIKEMSK